MTAFYDSKPSKFEAVGDGSYFYRWDIREVEVAHQQGDQEEDATKTQFACEEVVVWGTVSANKITQAVIADLIGSDHEQKLINEYNSAVLGMLPEEEAESKIEAYKAFLQKRSEVKAQVDADCAELGIR